MTLYAIGLDLPIYADARVKLNRQSSNEDGEGFRRVSVALDGPGLEARTIQGYYP